MYSFNIINWTIPEIRRLDMKIRKLLTCNRIHNPKVDVDRLYIPRNEEGRGIIQLEFNFWSTQIPYNSRLDATTSSCTLQNKKVHAISKQSYKFKQELNIR